MKISSPSALRPLFPALVGVLALASATVLFADSPGRSDRSGRSGGGEQRSVVRDDRSSGAPHRSYSRGPADRAHRASRLSPAG